LGSFKEKYPTAAQRFIAPHFASDDGFADIILPPTQKDSPEIKKVSSFLDIKNLVAGSGSDKASFKRISEAAWGYSETGFEDIYIPGGAVIWRYLTDEQLHSYYSNRENFKQGIFNTKYPTYIYIYIAECLIRDEAPENLAFILSNTATKYPNIKSDICRFLKDYYIVNDINITFSDYIKNIGAENFFPSYMNPPVDDAGAKLYAAGDYDLSKSRFLGEHFEIRRDFPKIFNAVIKNLEPLFSLFDLRVESLRTEGGEAEFYYPFTGVLYAGEFTRQGTAELTKAETYTRRGTWFMRSVSVIPSYTRKFSGFIKRQIDEQFRALVNYKYPLTDNAKPLAESLYALGGTRITTTLAKIISSEYLHGILRDICEAYLAMENELNSRTGQLLLDKMKTEPLLSYREIQRSETSPLRGLGIDEYTDYLSWRKNIENGIYENSDFIKTYIAEIVSDPNDGFEKLALIAANIDTAAVRKLMRNTLSGYYNFRKPSASFPELLIKYELTGLFPEIFINSEDKVLRAKAVIKLSGKGVKIPPELEKLFITVIDRVYENIDKHIKISALSADKKLLPFVLSFFVKLSEQIIKRELSYPGKINFENHAYFKVKFEEKFRYGVSDYGKKYLLSDDFPGMIEGTVTAVLREDFPEIKTYPGRKAVKRLFVPETVIEPIKVEVDFTKLDRVREEAEEITKKLATEEPEEKPPVVTVPEKPPEIGVNPFEDFYFSLDGVYKEVLALILSGGDVNAFLRGKNILPEVAAEHLNESALEFIGDIILEDMNIIDDYISDIKKVVKM
jgi:hypothetical protein